MNRPIPAPSANDFAPFHHISPQVVSLPCTAFCGMVSSADWPPMIPPCHAAAPAVFMRYRLMLPTSAFWRRSRYPPMATPSSSTGVPICMNFGMDSAPIAAVPSAAIVPPPMAHSCASSGVMPLATPVSNRFMYVSFPASADMSGMPTGFPSPCNAAANAPMVLAVSSTLPMPRTTEPTSSSSSLVGVKGRSMFAARFFIDPSGISSVGMRMPVLPSGKPNLLPRAAALSMRRIGEVTNARSHGMNSFLATYSTPCDAASLGVGGRVASLASNASPAALAASARRFSLSALPSAAYASSAAALSAAFCLASSSSRSCLYLGEVMYSPWKNLRISSAVKSRVSPPANDRRRTGCASGKSLRKSASIDCGML